MAEVHEIARQRRQRILAMGPVLPTRAEVAEALGSTVKTITNDIAILKAKGEKLRVRTCWKSRKDHQHYKDIRKAYARGDHISDICARYSVGSSFVNNVCKDVKRPYYTPAKYEPASYTTDRGDSFISTTYAATEERAKQFQEALHGGGA